MRSLSKIKADTFRLHGKYSPLLLLKAFLTTRAFRPLLTLRLCQSAAQSGTPGRLALPVCKVLHRMTSQLAGMDLPWQTDIGGGLAIAHGWGLVINPHVRIGTNVTLFHGVTLGQRDRIARDGTRSTGYPVLEDEVWVGPNAIIVGSITIGRGSRIAGGAFVTEDVPPHAIVSGNPAQVVKTNCSADIANPAPIKYLPPQMTGL